MEKNVQTPIFIDTVFILALVNRRDQHHENALSLAKQLDHYLLLITDAVLLEICNALARDYFFCFHSIIASANESTV